MPIRVVYNCANIDCIMAELTKYIEKEGEYLCKHHYDKENHEVTIYIFKINVPATKEYLFGLIKKDVLINEPLVKIILRNEQYYAWVGDYLYTDGYIFPIIIEHIAKRWEESITAGNKVTIKVTRVYPEEIKHMFEIDSLNSKY